MTRVRVFSDADVIFEQTFEENDGVIDMEIPLAGKVIGKFIRVEIVGLNERWICNSTPFWVV